ncbi:MAG: T9SS type A sorting domain-containing protein [Cytophagaceae bacterium]|jgi:hypothetical protein|nr:T9SS type A sorting domain-containing protein [Cytophagaceae bacterium]
MKQFLFSIFLVMLTGVFSNAQLTRRHNAPRGGDEIVKQRVSYKDPGRDGENVVWDFGQLLPVDPEYRLTYYTVPKASDSTYLVLGDTIRAAGVMPDELVVGVEHFTAYWYRVAGDALFTLGHENPVTLMRHNPPLLTMPFPFGYENKAEKEYRSQGLYSSKEPLITEGNIGIEADAYGKMVLPSGDTLAHVLRIRSLQTVADADTSRRDSLRLKMETETFRWYAKGYRYPVFETIRTFDVSDTSATEIFATAFFYPPQEHLYLEKDSANLAVLDSLWNIGTHIPPPHGGDHNDDTPPAPLNLTCNWYPNPVRDVLYVEYCFEATATVTVTLFDINGMAVRIIPEREFRKGIYRNEIDCAALPAGSYLLKLTVGGEVVTEMVVKR